MIYGSVCSGIEAATVAWHPLGWKASFYSEIEKFPRDVLAHHYPEVPLHGDFTTIQKEDYEPIELLVGGTPCQSFSVAGLRAGLNDPRGNLMLEFGALAKRLQPKWLVWENVPGVLSSNGGRDFGSFLAMLGELGYGFSYRVLDAQYFGVPQRRRRVFVVGCLGDWRSAAAVLFERHSLQGHSAPSREKGKEVTEIAGTLTSNGGGLNRPAGNANELVFCVTTFDRQAQGEYGTAPVASTMSARDYKSPSDLVVPHAFKVRGGCEGGGKGYLGQDDCAFTISTTQDQQIAVPAYGIPGNWIGRAPENGGNAVEPMLNVAPCQTKTDRHAVAHIATHDVAGTMISRASSGGFSNSIDHAAAGYMAMTPSMQVRRLTPTECERLQGFPDNYTKLSDKTADGPRYKALGNSMAVPVMAWIGSRIELIESMQKENAA